MIQIYVIIIYNFLQKQIDQSKNKKKYSKMIHRITKFHDNDDFCNKYI